MKYSNATNYALHTMVQLIRLPGETAIGVQELAKAQHLSPTYLSKILTKLTKAGLIESTPGAKGGYRLARSERDISFFDVIQAIEGETHLFDCTLHRHEGCLIEKVMRDAEANMKQELQEQLLVDIAYQVDQQQGGDGK